MRVRFDYKDAHGNTSRRIVQVAGFTATGFYGTCELRNERRTFLFARGSSFIDMDTGEIIVPEERNYAQAQHEVRTACTPNR